MSSISNPVIPKGEVILVTGVTGYIGSHVADQALAAGYKVRGAVRDSAKAQWLQTLFDQKYGSGKFEIVVLQDILNQEAVYSAIKGVSGIAHIANDSNLSPNPDPYIANAINGALNVLKGAAKEPKVKSIVLTSSSMAAAGYKGNLEFEITPDTYHDDAIKLAWDDTFQDPAKAFIVYGAAKAESEKAAWKWIEENTPGFVFNTVLPAANFGPALSPENQGLPSTGGWPKMVFEGSFDAILAIPLQYFVNVKDNARIHVGALLSPGVKNQRLFTYVQPYNYNDLLASLRKLYPSRKFVDDIPGLGKDLSQVPIEPAKNLLAVFGQSDWTPLEKSLKDSLDEFATN